MNYTTVRVNCSSSYDIIIGNRIVPLFSELFYDICKDARRILFVTDENVLGYHSDLIKSFEKEKIAIHTCVLSGGESEKNADSANKVYDMLLRKCFTRNDAIIAFGGGVVGDIAGYCAATFMRGIPYVQIPTTIIAQTDSSVGGKTAINYNGRKNIIGAFCQPRLVCIDTELLTTLSPRELRCGMAEVIKYAAIADKELFAMLKRDGSNVDITKVVERCVKLKKRYVECDEFDNGERRLLNFGHTVGHAIEAASCNMLLHGEAVAIGMLYAVKVGEALGVTPKNVMRELKSVIESFGLSTSMPQPFCDTYKQYISADKKRTGNEISFVLLEELGSACVRKIPVSVLEEILE